MISNDNRNEEHLLELLGFLEEYTACLFGTGVHSSRVIRNARRIAESQGAELTLYSSLRAEILSLRDQATGKVLSRVVPVPAMGNNFEINSDLSALSWEALDSHLSLDEIRSRYERLVSRRRLSPWIVLLLISLANGAFCHLFGGDGIAVVIVIVSTAIGFRLKQCLSALHSNEFLVVVACSFVASMLASTSVFCDATSQVAVATSPLFLVPGVPLINSVIDIIEGHVVTGVSRLVKALLIICCIGIGLAGTLIIMQNSLLYNLI